MGVELELSWGGELERGWGWRAVGVMAFSPGVLRIQGACTSCPLSQPCESGRHSLSD